MFTVDYMLYRGGEPSRASMLGGAGQLRGLPGSQGLTDLEE